MLCLVFISVVTITLSGIYSEHVVKARSIEYDQEDLQCEAHCRQYRKHCANPPYLCGGCLDGHIERGGVCRPPDQEREITDEDIDTLIDEYRKLKQKTQEELAKEKPILAVYNGRHSPSYQQGLPDYPQGQGQYRGHQQGQGHWDRGEGLVEPEDYGPPEEGVDIGHKPNQPRPYYLSKGQGHFRGEGHHNREEEEEKEVEVPEEVPEEVEKESDMDGGVRIKPVPHDEEEVEDKMIHATPAAQQEYDDKLHPMQEVASMADIYFLAVVAGCSVAGLVGLVVAGVCWYRLQKNVKAASEVEYPAYGITGPTKETVGSPGDRKLAQSAQMYHYQHQKQQMIALEKANGEMKQEGSEDDSDEENEEGDYTVYECPGLAPTGEMEVKNPLFNEETPVTPTPDDRRDMK